MKEQKTVFITDATTGFGLLNAKLYSEQGWNVVAAVRNPDQATELNKLKNLLLVKVDVTSKEMLEAAIWQTLAQFGSIEEVINNADYGDANSVSEIINQAMAELKNSAHHPAQHDDKVKMPAHYQRSRRMLKFAL